MLARLTRSIQEKLALTKSEAGIILFLSFGLILGGTAKILNLDKPASNYDFSSSDSTFIAASAKIDSIVKADEDTAAIPKRHSKSELSTAQPVNVNEADVEQLMKLPGVGRITAQRIVDYRQANGRFTSPEDLRNVKGIGAAKLEKMKPYVRTE